jgi:glycosyltransferase involved in cell wall biosynthesis
MGRLSPEKNCLLLIEAFERIKTSAKLVLAGGSSHSRSYVQQLHRHRSDRIIFVDWVSGAALDELLTNAMLFVLPSDMEGLSLALLDAMAAGVCVLASDIPENVELVHNAGFTFQKGNVDDLERALRSLIWNPMLREHARREAQARVTNEYLWPKIADQVEAMYFDLMGREPKRDSLEAERPAA